MNISITQITNGFVVAVQTPKGNFATYCKTFDEVVVELQKMNEEPPNVESISRK